MVFELTNVSTPVLRDVTLAVPAGAVTVIVGPSGSGKSSLLRLLNRLDVPNSGTVRFEGDDLASIEPRTLRRQVGMVFQRPTVFDGTGIDNLRVADPALDERSVVRLLDRVGLHTDAAGNEIGHRDARTLSGGEAQRLCLARTLATDPRVLLLDEPTSALDSNSVHVIEHLVRSFAEAGGTAIWVSHDRAQVRRMADHLVQLAGGEVVAAGAHEAMGHIHDDDDLWIDGAESST